MITVTTSSGSQQVGGTDWSVEAGILTVMDDAGTGLAVFAPGVWQSAAVVTP